MNILCLGDSLTFGYGVARSQSWPSLLQKNESYLTKNAGVCGDTTGGMLSRLDSELKGAPPDLVILLGGANDIFFSGSDQNARSNMAAMVHQILGRGLVPLIVLPPPIVPMLTPRDWQLLVSFDEASQQLDRYRHWLSQFSAAFQVTTADCCTPFYQDGILQTQLFLDGLHPTASGHESMAEALLQTLTQYHFS